jgi:hypothetical protein
MNLILAGAAVIATFLAYWTINAGRKSLEAELLNDLLREYSTEDMLNFVRTLWDFNEENSDVAKAYREKYKPSERIDLARRGVSQYYQRISKLRKAGYVSDLFVKTVCGTDPIKLIRGIVILIEKAHAEIYHQKFNEESLEYLLKVIEAKDC